MLESPRPTLTPAARALLLKELNQVLGRLTLPFGHPEAADWLFRSMRSLGMADGRSFNEKLALFSRYHFGPEARSEIVQTYNEMRAAGFKPTEATWRYLSESLPSELTRQLKKDFQEVDVSHSDMIKACMARGDVGMALEWVKSAQQIGWGHSAEQIAASLLRQGAAEKALPHLDAMEKLGGLTRMLCDKLLGTLVKGSRLDEAQALLERMIRSYTAPGPNALAALRALAARDGVAIPDAAAAKKRLAALNPADSASESKQPAQAQPLDGMLKALSSGVARAGFRRTQIAAEAEAERMLPWLDAALEPLAQPKQAAQLAKRLAALAEAKDAAGIRAALVESSPALDTKRFYWAARPIGELMRAVVALSRFRHLLVKLQAVELAPELVRSSDRGKDVPQTPLDCQRQQADVALLVALTAAYDALHTERVPPLELALIESFNRAGARCRAKAVLEARSMDHRDYLVAFLVGDRPTESWSPKHTGALRRLQRCEPLAHDVRAMAASVTQKLPFLPRQPADKDAIVSAACGDGCCAGAYAASRCCRCCKVCDAPRVPEVEAAAIVNTQ